MTDLHKLQQDLDGTRIVPGLKAQQRGGFRVTAMHVAREAALELSPDGNELSRAACERIVALEKIELADHPYPLSSLESDFVKATALIHNDEAELVDKLLTFFRLRNFLRVQGLTQEQGTKLRHLLTTYQANILHGYQVQVDFS